MRHSKHLWRAGLILLFGAVGLFLLRHFLIPESFGLFGFYRGDAARAEMGRPTQLGPADACRECHPAVWDKKSGGKHATLDCAGCHAPLPSHAAGGNKIATMITRKTAAWCLRCHLKQTARPAEFPQLEPDRHLTEQGAAFSPAVCFDCHDPHSPLEGL